MVLILTILAILPLLAMIFMITVIRMLRGIRKARELQLSRVPLALSPEVRKLSDDYHDQVWLPLCTRIAEAASSRLNRPLTQQERRSIWRTRTALLLEVILKEIQSAPTPESIASLLATLPPGMDRPDPTGWCADSQAPA